MVPKGLVGHRDGSISPQIFGQKVDKDPYPCRGADAAHEYGVNLLDIAGVELLQDRDELAAGDLLSDAEGADARYADRTKHVVEAGDIEEAIRAANAVGDDRLQSRSRGYVVPDSFTHGTSEQRVRWFRRGYETGDLSQGDTFNAREL